METHKGSQGESIVLRLLGPANPRLSTGRELRFGTYGSLSVDLGKLSWFDHERSIGGGLIDLVVDRRGGSRAEAAAWLRAEGLDIGAPQGSGPERRIVASYSYHDEAGDLLFEVVRFAPKDFRQRRPDGRGGWSWSIKGVRRVPYRLPELSAADPQAPVFLVEGEKDADRLAGLGLVATTIPGGAGKWRADYAACFQGRRVVLVPDNDAPGRAHAEAIANTLEGTAARVAVLALDGLPAKADVSDWLDAGGSPDTLRERAEAALAAPTGAGEDRSRAGPDVPTPLYAPRGDPEPFPVDALGPLAPAARGIERITQAPVEIAAQSVLAAASLAVQPLADVETLGGSAPCSLFLLTVAESGERKSAVDRLATEAIQALQVAECRTYRATLAELDEDGRRSPAAASARPGRSCAPVIDDVDPDDEAAPPRPLKPLRLLSDPTFEGICRHFETGLPSVGLFSDEGGQILGGHAMSREHRIKTATGISRLWDGAPINRTRGSEAATTHFGRRVSLHLMVQPRLADDLLGDERLRDQGLLSRLLIAWPRSRIGTRRLDVAAGGDANPDPALGVYRDRLLALLVRPLPTHPNAPQELCPRPLPLTGEARPLLVDFFNAVEEAQAPCGSLASLHGPASKMAEQACRLAAVQTLFENPDASAVDFGAMRNGIALASWFLEEARRLIDTPHVPEHLAKAQRLLDWLQQTWTEDHVSIRALMRFGPNALRQKPLLTQLTAILADAGWLTPVDGPVVLRGDRARMAWKIVRP